MFNRGKQPDRFDAIQYMVFFNKSQVELYLRFSFCALWVDYRLALMPLSMLVQEIRCRIPLVDPSIDVLSEQLLCD